MSINVKIGSAPAPAPRDATISVNIDRTPTIGVNINNPYLHEIKFKLNIREAHNGDLMIFDHPDIDIVLMVEKKKIVTFAKDLATDVGRPKSSQSTEIIVVWRWSNVGAETSATDRTESGGARRVNAILSARLSISHTSAPTSPRSIKLVCTPIGVLASKAYNRSSTAG